ncbi:MAG: RNA polymerase sigma factor [Acidimicrobiales bacterium]
MQTLLASPAEFDPDQRPRRARWRPLEQPTDDLVRAARAGDSDAAGELYRRTWTRARRVATGFCRPDDADDAAAEGLSRALLRLEQLRDPASAEAWLLRCVVRAAIDQSRQLQRHQTLRARAVAVGLASATVEAADEAAMETLDRATMAAAIDDLPPPARRLLLERYGSAIPLRTLASAWQVPEGTIRRQCVDARRHAGQRYLYRQLRPVTDQACARVTNLLCREPYHRPGPRLRRHTIEHLRRCSACRDRQRELACVLRELRYRTPPG